MSSTIRDSFLGAYTVFHDEDGGRAASDDISGTDGLPSAPVERPDLRPILLRPCATDKNLSDKTDILDLVRKRIDERKLEPKDIRKTIKGWRPEEHYRVTSGFYDCDISQRRAYQLATTVGLKRTKRIPFEL